MDTSYYTTSLAAYRSYNNSPIQERLRDEAPVLVGAVYWNPQQDTEDTIRYELQRMKETGFTFVRFHAIEPILQKDGSWDFSYPDLRIKLAEEAGLEIYPHMHLHAPKAEMLAKHGVSVEAAKRLSPLTDERVAAAMRDWAELILGHYQDCKAITAWPMGGEPNATGIPLRDEQDQAEFKAWLQQTYASPADVHANWLIYPEPRTEFRGSPYHKVTEITDWDQAVAIARCIQKKEPGKTLATTGLNRHELYGANRDLIRFRADATEAYERWVVAMIHEIDPDTPICYGNHQLFYANGELAWDQHRCGRVGDMHFTSIHMSWHFESAQGEFDRPHYLQSRLTNDIFKGGYTNAYETTGGPVQYSGGYGNHMDAPYMRKLMLNFLASGNEGSAFWDWVPRPGGMEAGEYGLVSLSGRVTEWAEECGVVARAMERYRKEIWNWDVDAELAILRSWDTEAVMTSEPTRFDCEDGPTGWSRGPAQQHVRGWIGAGRAAIDGQVDFQYVTTDEIKAGLDGVYPAIYLPHVRCIDDTTLERLISYVEAGGRLIADVQCGFEDNFGKVRAQGEGQVMERLFGGWVDSIHDARSRPQSVDGIDCPGFFGELCTTTANVVRRFDTGKPAIIEHRLGQGLATLVGFDLGHSCWKPGASDLQDLLVDLYRGPEARRWRCGVPMTFRRSHADADHYFIVNDGPARSTVLRVFDRDGYSAIEDVLDGGSLPTETTIAVDVPAYSAKWLRCAKR